MNVLLSGIVGSTAYGLATPGSDVDRLGMFAVDTVRLHGLENVKESVVTTKPDITLHEVRKWCQLALKCNPTVMELLWLPDDLYEDTTPLGEDLISLRMAFLSSGYVRNAYLGYATKQFELLEKRGDGTFSPDLAGRTAKHARHMYRLLVQGLGLWTTGRLTIRVGDPDGVMSFGERVELGDIGCAKKLLADYEEAFDRTRCVLAHEPERDVIERWLRRVRATYYQP